MKRFLDAMGAAGILLAASPLLLAVSGLILLDSGPPVLYRHRRVGLHLRTFQLLKFRSMVPDADRQGPWFTKKGDARITRIGAFLRRTSLDELPQLFNVLRGEMSLVGPRPDVPEQMELYTEEERRLRHSVRPGMTGWAQVMCRNDGTVELRRRLDLEYVRRTGFLFDCKILLFTVRQLVMRGSY